MNWTFTIQGEPVGKPRMTRADKWRQRKPVMQYRAWADRAREAAPDLPEEPLRVEAVAYLPMPKSWSSLKRDTARGAYHRQKPDGDNILKAICDALFQEDKVIAIKRIEKRWDDGNGPRVEVNVYLWE